MKKVVPYNDLIAEFYGGPMKKMMTTGYEKGLKNLWKADVLDSSLGFKDASKFDKLGIQNLDKETFNEIEGLVSDIQSDSFKKVVEDNYSPEEREALAKILCVIMHGEAFALWVSASLIGELKGTGTRMALAMQVMEEAKHFLVLREAIKQIDKIHPQLFWDKILLQRIARAEPINRLFGMNVVLEGVALNFFSTFGDWPALDRILPFFHLDEARHTALPHNYAEHGITFWDKHSPKKQIDRMLLVLPFFGVLFDLEEDARVLDFDIYEFGGMAVDKIFRLSERSGFYMPFNKLDVVRFYNLTVAIRKRITDKENFQGVIDLTTENTITIDEKMKEIENEIFGTEDVLRRTINTTLEPIKAPIYDVMVKLLESSR